jgi:hypothetical protein
MAQVHVLSLGILLLRLLVNQIMEKLTGLLELLARGLIVVADVHFERLD